MASDCVEIVQVHTRRQLRRFARFATRLYKDSPYYVPELESDVMDAFIPSRNAALEYCEAQPFLAFRDGRVVGRVAAIINRVANERWNTRTVRFGWLDFTDDSEVSSALLRAVADWGRQRGMTRIEGPLGFSDFDREGMLTWGFDQIATQSTNYNFEYYPQHIQALGFEPTARWVEWHIPCIGIPERMNRLSQAVLERYGLHVARYDSSVRTEAAHYAKSLFRLVNEAYSPLYGYSPFSEHQIDDMVRRYLKFIDKRLVTIVLDSEDNLVAAGLVMPSMSRGLQKARGRLFPLGWWHLLKAIWHDRETIDLMVLAVKPEYQGRGLNAVPFCNLAPNIIGMGFKWAESNLELETNSRMQSHWTYFEGAYINKRRCAFAKDI